MDASATGEQPARVLGFWSIAALQFALICVLGNVADNLGWGVGAIGPAVVVAWVVGGLLQLLVALSMAELLSAYPGPCYRWVRAWSGRTLAWFTAWALLFGYVAATAENDMSLSGTMLAFGGRAHPPALAVLLIALLCLALQAGVTVAGTRLAARGALVIAAVQVVAIAIVVAALSGAGLTHGISFLTHTGSPIGVEHEHLPPFILTLLIPGWTILGFDLSGNLAPETREPQQASPRSLMAASVLAYVLGTALFAVPILATSNLRALAASSAPLQFLLTSRLSSPLGDAVMALVIACLFYFPVVLLVSASRLLSLQARDGAWPVAPFLVDSARLLSLPVRSTLVCAAAAAFLCLAWSPLYALGTVWEALWALGYAVAIAAGLAARYRGALPVARAWNLGRLGTACAILGVGWCLFLAALLLLSDLPHAGPMFVLVALVGAIAYLWSVEPRWPSIPAGRRE